MRPGALAGAKGTSLLLLTTWQTMQKRNMEKSDEKEDFELDDKTRRLCLFKTLFLRNQEEKDEVKIQENGRGKGWKTCENKIARNILPQKYLLREGKSAKRGKINIMLPGSIRQTVIDYEIVDIKQKIVERINKSGVFNVVAGKGQDSEL